MITLIFSIKTKLKKIKVQGPSLTLFNHVFARCERYRESDETREIVFYRLWLHQNTLTAPAFADQLESILKWESKGFDFGLECLSPIIVPICASCLLVLVEKNENSHIYIYFNEIKKPKKILLGMRFRFLSPLCIK